MDGFSSKAILLKKIEYGESDNIVTFYTRKKGKLKSFARKAKKSKKRFGSMLDLFAYVSADFSSPAKGSLYALNSVSLCRTFGNIRSDLYSIAAANYMLELFYEMTPENVENEKLFYFLVSFLEELDSKSFRISLLPIYVIKFFRLTGIGPHFSTCTVCKRPFDNKRWIFKCGMGGIVCTRCSSERLSGDMVLRPETINLMIKEQKMADNFIRRVLPSRVATKELFAFTDRYIEYHLGKRLNSAKFMEEIDGKTHARVQKVG